MIKLDWIAFKNLLTYKSLNITGTEDSNSYYLFLSDGSLVFSCDLVKSNVNSHLVDFETNYKPTWNKKITMSVAAIPAFAEKTYGDKKLFKQVVGLSQSCNTGENEIIWECGYNQVKYMGTEVVGGEIGDTASVYVLDRDGENELLPPIYGTPNAILKQFGFSVNIAKDFYSHKSEFPADFFIGMQMKFVYNSISNKTIGINLVLNEVTS